MKIELSKSYKVAGHEVKEIELDLESLTGTELLACEKEFKLKNKYLSLVFTIFNFVSFIVHIRTYLFQNYFF